MWKGFSETAEALVRFRWSFYGVSDVGVGLSLAMTLLFMGLCLAGVAWIFRTGYRLKS